MATSSKEERTWTATGGSLRHTDARDARTRDGRIEVELPALPGPVASKATSVGPRPPCVRVRLESPLAKETPHSLVDRYRP